ncbi:hypothetical protein BB559_004797 [Furculomyces boomerangus]|uniref:Protein PNS1 n=2 Tax=Harpellales TaxID=61421 RepID=A0A2T9YCQ8_9FUNG|nr:hypothetical protein BB559_004797 [Furculomyces boomerangus]PVZ99291.1 hypothetical protein BB558_004689 [Smittium angustum]
MNNNQYTNPYPPGYNAQPGFNFNQQNDFQNPPQGGYDAYTKPMHPPPPVPEYGVAPDQFGQPGQANIKYNKTPKFRDLWAAILFLAFFGLFVVLAVLFISAMPSGSSKPTSVSSTFLTSKNYITLGSVIVVSFVISILYLFLCKAFPYGIIVCSFWFSVLFFLATGIYYIFAKIYFAGALLILFSLLYAFSWRGWKRAIPFTKLILQNVLQVITKFPSTIVLTIFWSILAIAFNTLWVVTLTSAPNYMEKYQTCTTKTDSNGNTYRSCSNTNLVLTYVFLAFIYFWTIQVIFNVLHTAICGLFATYYFFDGTPEGYPTKHPLLASLGRASTYSFGSICFGSLIVAIIQTIRAILNYIRHSDDNNIITSILIVCADCILSCIEALVEYFNKYAYIEIAIYGKPFMQAAKDTWHLIKERGIEALINDSLINNVILMGSFMTGVICALLTYILARVINTSLASNSSYLVGFTFVGFIFGASVFTTINGVVQSGASATFVCLAEDPYAIARNKPELFSQIAEHYPDVVRGIHY